MLRALFGYEKHFQMVDDVYKGRSGSEEKLSKLITYLKSRTSTIPSTLDYLKIRAGEEVYSTHRLKTGSKVLRLIIDQLRGVSICYESRIIRIFVGVIREILQLKRKGDFEYSDHQEFLDVFTYFFKTVPIRAYESERYIRKILFIATQAAKDVKNSDGIAEGLSLDDEAEYNEKNVLETTNVWKDEGRQAGDFRMHGDEQGGEISNARFEYFFLEIIHTLMGMEDILRIDYDEKYKWLVGSLMKHGEVNSSKRMEIFKAVAGKANIISGNSLIYYVLKNASWMGKSCVGTLTEYLGPDLYPQIILQANMNILERGKRVHRDKKIGRSKAVGECEFLVREALGVLNEYEVLHLNQKEIVVSFFSILEMFFSRDDSKLPFIIPYVRKYFEKCKPISDVFYRFLKKILQDKEVSGYTEDLRTTIFDEIQRYFVVHSDWIPNPKFMTLLLGAGTGESAGFCCKILYLAKDYFMGRALKPFVKERVMRRLRVLFCETENRDIQYLLMDLVGDGVSKDSHYKILCLFGAKKILNEELVKEMYKGRYLNVSEVLFGEFGCEALEPYDLDTEKRMEEIESEKKKAQDCELDVKFRRHTRIALVDYEKHFR
ncbi:uncharacterized protein Eint_020510 [Encephalitozoon intestinalis ATCC 50506]|uniref:Uncharacterized protein n=1 Tax=Encephalitozoon intestinalis (strain ATCC 50506) TaxID=876142 RepID=E0S5R5_ENCIT|nr:uncharacterized protein Eint_020510 [Encephalitozoon intestinalis ATCC 50506]ADM11050.1 hypothetical protein Eint_020510 [Encephalitozoon intestinalis ATCC 50506]UTX44699.1 hypothetical protein GPK93_02g02160 [Encephalitozoon intestinalis]